MLAIGVAAAHAQAAFPGENGEIAYIYDDFEIETAQICTIPGGCITQVNGPIAREPAWSPNGQMIAFWDEISEGSFTINEDNSAGHSIGAFAYSPAWSPAARGKIVLVDAGLTTVNVDGSGFAQLTNNDTDGSPDWSPDGSQIAFTRTTDGNREIHVISPDTGQETRLTNSAANESSPDFSPDGSKIIFSAGNQLHTMYADGTGRTPLSLAGINPSWSPDEQMIVYEVIESDFSSSIRTADADGTDPTIRRASSVFDAVSDPDWQPLPVNTPSSHVRAAGASPFRVSLVPAFNACTTGNRTHGPPLVFPSCNPPQPGSPNLTVGVGDGDPALSRSVGYMRIAVWPGAPGGPDDTDARVRFNLTNVMRASDLSEYTGELRASARVRLTGREGTVAQTALEFPLEFDVPCVPTGPVLDKSVCDLTTTLDSITPGAAAEGMRAVWALGQVKVYDGGPDEDADTTADNSLFAVQGVFIP
jgi:TolB protein